MVSLVISVYNHLITIDVNLITFIIIDVITIINYSQFTYNTCRALKSLSTASGQSLDIPLFLRILSKWE